MAPQPAGHGGGFSGLFNGSVAIGNAWIVAKAGKVVALAMMRKQPWFWWSRWNNHWRNGSTLNKR